MTGLYEALQEIERWASGEGPRIADRDILEVIVEDARAALAEVHTNDGLTARVYTRNGGGTMPVHGAVLIDGIWFPKQWNLKGWAASDEPGEGDLVDFVPGG